MPARPARPVRVFGTVIGAATVAALIGTCTPAFAASSTSDVGLYGSQDPTYDGVYRQSLAIIALEATGKTPDASAVSWLLAQQCADGTFTAYRANPATACTAAGEDENATAAAIQALVALGKPTSTAITALKHFQLADGGFYDNTAFGAPASDANSTGLALSALAAAGIDPTSVTSSGKNGDDYLRTIQLPCSAASGAGAYDFQAEARLAANDYATVQATLGQLGKALPVAATTVAATAPTCGPATDSATSAADAVGYLAARLTAGHGAIPSSLGSGSDWTSTANAVLDLVAAKQGSAAVAAGLAALQSNAKAYAAGGQSGGTYAPGPLATLLLVAHATGTDPASFGGIDLAAALAATERTAAPAPSPSPTPTATARPTATSPGTGSSGPTLPMTGAKGVLPLGATGAALLLLGGIALAVSRRRAGDETA
jgi:hypothetical protein